MYSPYLKDCLNRKLIFFTGKGGVGKSSISIATALMLKNMQKKVLVTSFLEFDRFTKQNNFEALSLEYLYLDPSLCFKEYALLTLKFEKIYDYVFDNKVLRTFIAAAPGLSDTVIAGKLESLAMSNKYDHVIVDLPSSGHALHFFQSPLGVEQIFSIGSVARDVERICAFFKSSACRLDLISSPEDLSLTENLELKRNLEAISPISFGFLHLNLMTPKFSLPEIDLLPSRFRPHISYYESQLRSDDEARVFSKAFDLPVTEIERLTKEEAPLIEELAARLKAA